MPKRRALLPSAFDIVFVALALVVPFAWVEPLLNADGDLARHLRVGDTILQHGLFFRDLFSNTKLGKPFVPYEWLSEVVFAVVNRIGGLAAVSIFCGLVIGATYALLVLFLRRRGVDPLLAFLVGMLAAAVSCVHWLARPHLFTPLAAVLLLFLLERRPDRWGVLLVAPLFVAWANLHGGFFFGLVLIGVFLAGDLMELHAARRAAAEPTGGAGNGGPAGEVAQPGRGREAAALDGGAVRRRLGYHAALLLVGAAACLVNPEGPALFGHVIGWFGQRYIINNTAEYLSPNFHMRSVQIFLGALILLVGALGMARTRISWPRLLVITADTFFALYSGRNIPLFAVTALPLAALELDAEWRGLPFLGRLRQGFAEGDAASRGGVWSGAVAVALMALLVNGGRVASHTLVSARFDPRIFPVDAVRRARAAGLGGRMFNAFGWGGYILYAWPEQRVFIDGQTDFYGDTIFRTYQDIAGLQAGWRRQLDSLQISLVIVGSKTALGNELQRLPGWTRWYGDSTAVILRRSAAGATGDTGPSAQKPATVGRP
jgi:hypothetical protein